MCGIFGFLGTRLEGRVTERVLDQLTCRGPDEQAWVRPSPTDGVACARLSLWHEGDCEQPHVFQQWCVAMNGEIFNLDELRVHLELPGASEVQVLTVGWLRHGPQFFSRIDGQFAALMLDTRARIIRAIRDPLGICPLYYSVSGRAIQLGSSIASLAAIRRPADSDLSIEGLLRTAAWWGSNSGATCWQHIRQLPPGNELSFSDHGQLRISPFSSLRHSPAARPGSEDTNTVPNLGAMLREAVSARSRGNQPIATLLSGGVDSAVIAHAAVEAGVKHSFGLVLSDEDDVAAQQQRIAIRLGITHKIVPVDGLKLVEALPAAIDQIGMPISRLGPIGMYLLARQVSQAGFRSCLSGEGADELFGGYDSFRLARLSLEPSNDQIAQMGCAELKRMTRPLYWRFAQGAQWNPLVGRLAIARFMRHYLVSEVSHELESMEAESSAFDDWPDKLEAVRQIELSYTLGGYLLGPQGDHVWASQAVEVRYPWLSRAVVNVALGSRARDLFRLDEGKVPIRELSRRWLGEQWINSNGIDFGKHAYRVDVNLIINTPACKKFEELIAMAPKTILQVDKTLKLWARCQEQGSLGDRESSVLTLAATLGAIFR